MSNSAVCIVCHAAGYTACAHLPYYEPTKEPYQALGYENPALAAATKDAQERLSTQLRVGRNEEPNFVAPFRSIKRLVEQDRVGDAVEVLREYGRQYAAFALATAEAAKTLAAEQPDDCRAILKDVLGTVKACCDCFNKSAPNYLKERVESYLSSPMREIRNQEGSEAE